MKKVKSFVALLLAAIFMMSFLCACDGIMPVKVDKEVDAFLDGFFETLFEAVEEMDSEKIIPYWYIPEKYKDFENVKEQVTTITKENIKRILRQDYPKPNKIV